MVRQWVQVLMLALGAYLVIVGEATHTMLLERNRLQLFREVQAFLDEK